MMTGYLLFFFNDTATTEIYTLSLHDALPILLVGQEREDPLGELLDAVAAHAALALHPLHEVHVAAHVVVEDGDVDRKSTRLNSSHANISYAVFCLKKKTTNNTCFVISTTLSC